MRCVVECVRVERVVWAVGAVGRARSEGRVRVLWVVETPVSRPKLIVPTNLQMAIVGDGIVNVEGIMCGSSWNGWRGARLEMLQSIGEIGRAHV